MSLRVLYLFLVVIYSFKIYAQQQPFVVIKDHNKNKEDVNIDCDYKFNSYKCITLTAEYSEIRGTNEYTVSTIPYSVTGDINQGNILSIGSNGKIDDRFSDKIPLGFSFCFYGINYNEIIIGDNGVISFNIANANGNCASLFTSGTPNNSLEPSSIFGVFHDLIVKSDQCPNGKCGEIKTKLEGVAPYRKFIINYNDIYQVPPVNGYKSSSQIVLYETTNIIDVSIKKKTNKNDKAIVGLINQDKTKGIAPTNRNGTEWDAENETYRFTPAGQSSIQVNWFDEFNRYIGFGNDIEVCPNSKTNYKAIVTYNSCNPFSIEDKINIDFSTSFPMGNNISKVFCVKNDEEIEIDLKSLIPEINPDKDLKITFHNNREDANLGLKSISLVKTNNNTTIFSRILKSGVCYIISEINLKFNKAPKIQNQEINICDEKNDLTEIINLLNLNIKGYNSSSMTLKFYPNEKSAIDGIGEITKSSNFNLNKTIDFYIRAYNTTFNEPSCFNVSKITVKLTPILEPNNLEIPLCFVSDDEIVNINISEVIGNKLFKNSTNNARIEYYTNLDYTSQISNLTNYPVKVGNILYAKGFSENFCPNNATIKFTSTTCNDSGSNSGGGGGGGGGYSGNQPSCNSNSIVIFDLMKDYNSITDNGKNTTLIGFYKSFKDAEKEENKILDISNYTVNPPNSNDVFIKFTDNLTGIKFIKKKTLHAYFKVESAETVFDVCDVFNDGEEILNLEKDYVEIFSQLYGGLSSKITFYDSSQNLNSGKGLKQLLLRNNKKIFILVELSVGCKFVYEVNFILKTIEIKELKKSVCDFGSDQREFYDLTIYEKEIKENYINDILKDDIKNIKYYISLNLAHQGNNNYIYNPSIIELIYPNNLTYYVRYEFYSDCFKIFKLNFTLTSSIQLPKIKDIFTCDDDDNGTEKVDITKSVDEIPKNTTIKYYTTNQGALENDSNFQIIDVKNYFQTSFNTPVYLRITDEITNCYKVIQFTSHIIKLPELLNKKINICDTRNDNIEKIYFDQVTNQLISNNGSIINNSMIFEYYKTKQDVIHEKEIEILKTDKIWVKIIFNKDSGCFRIFELSFEFIESPILKSYTDTICDNNTENTNNETQAQINLDIYKENILQSNLSNDFKFSYFKSEKDALENNNKLNSNYTITNFPTVIYTKVLNQKTRCFSITTLTINRFPKFEDINKNLVISFCADQSLTGVLNLNDYLPEMVSNKDKYIIDFFESKHDAISNNKKIENRESYLVTPKTQIWIRFQDKLNNCIEIRNILIDINEEPKIFPVINYLCDDNIDGIYKVNLDQNFGGQITLELDKSIYDYKFYNSESDLLNDKNRLDSSYEFKDIDLSTVMTNYKELSIYINATSKANKCSKSTKVNIRSLNKVPLLTEEFSIFLCDDVLGNGKEVFNLTSIENQFTNETNVKFDYYKTKEDAQKQENKINIPDSYTNQDAYQDEVFVRLSKENFCTSLVKINLKVDNFIKSQDITPIPICEFTPEGKPNTFNLSSFIPKMRISISDELFSKLDITYYKSIENAKNKKQKFDQIIIESYNIPVGKEEIYVRFENKDTGCFNINKINLEKLKAPKVNQLKKIICDNDLNEVFEVNLETYNAEIINTSTHTFSYFKDESSSWKGENSINSDYIITSFPHTIFVRIEDKTNKCINISKIDFETFEKVPLLSNSVDIYACDDDENGISNFNLINSAPLLTKVSSSTFSYYYTKEDAKNGINKIENTMDYQSKLPNKDYIFARIESPNYCPNIAKINLITYKFINNLNESYLFCPNTKLELDAGKYDAYLWNTGEETQKITVGNPSNYSVTVFKKINFGQVCEKTFNTNIKFHDIPKIIDVEEQDDNFTIIASGEGELDYSIDGINWQNSNYFNHLDTGIYTVYARSRQTNCISEPFQVLMFKANNFISPNNDGINDTWNICGLNSFKNKQSSIKIFDRYGKNIFEQSSNNCFNWDGTYLGRVLNSTSYWYVITLADGRVYNGWINLKNY